MRFIILVICFLVTSEIIAQQKGVVYYAVYETGIKTKTKVQLNEKKSLTKEDSLLSEFSKLFIEELEKSGLNIKLIDSLIHYNDTSFIKTVSDQNSGNNGSISLNVNIEDSDVLLFRNKFWIRTDDSLTLRPVSGDYEKFGFAEKGEQILGYDTQIFTNDTKTTRIWVCENLPPGLNPKIKISNPVGAILKYEIKKEDQVSSSIVVELRKERREKQKI